MRACRRRRQPEGCCWRSSWHRPPIVVLPPLLTLGRLLLLTAKLPQGAVAEAGGQRPTPNSRRSGLAARGLAPDRPAASLPPPSLSPAPPVPAPAAAVPTAVPSSGGGGSGDGGALGPATPSPVLLVNFEQVQHGEFIRLSPGVGTPLPSQGGGVSAVAGGGGGGDSAQRSLVVNANGVLVGRRASLALSRAARGSGGRRRGGEEEDDEASGGQAASTTNTTNRTGTNETQAANTTNTTIRTRADSTQAANATNTSNLTGAIATMPAANTTNTTNLTGANATMAGDNASSTTNIAAANATQAANSTNTTKITGANATQAANASKATRAPLPPPLPPAPPVAAPPLPSTKEAGNCTVGNPQGCTMVNTGCRCNWTAVMRTDCACCYPGVGACPCGLGAHEWCVKCGDTESCDTVRHPQHTVPTTTTTTTTTYCQCCGCAWGNPQGCTAANTGCTCAFDHSRQDCACCSLYVGACQCGSLWRNWCARCGDGDSCNLGRPQTVCTTTTTTTTIMTVTTTTTTIITTTFFFRSGAFYLREMPSPGVPARFVHPFRDVPIEGAKLVFNQSRLTGEDMEIMMFDKVASTMDGRYYLKDARFSRYVKAVSGVSAPVGGKLEFADFPPADECVLLTQKAGTNKFVLKDPGDAMYANASTGFMNGQEIDYLQFVAEESSAQLLDLLYEGDLSYYGIE